MKEFYQKEDILSLIKNRDDAVIQGILTLYENQVCWEKHNRLASIKNGRGFNKFDAKRLSELAEGFKCDREPTKREISIARRKLIKYAGQLAKITNHVRQLPPDTKKYIIEARLLPKNNIENIQAYTLIKSEIDFGNDWPKSIFIQLKNPQTVVGVFKLLFLDKNDYGIVMFAKYMHTNTGDVLFIFNK